MTDLLSGCKILVADDSPDLKQVFQLLLESAGATVVSCDDGECAWDTYCEAVQAGQPFDLVLMDNEMPGVNGVEVLRMMKRANAAQKAVIITGNPQIRAENIGAPVWAKPLQIGSLKLEVERILFPERFVKKNERRH